MVGGHARPALGLSPSYSHRAERRDLALLQRAGPSACVSIWRTRSRVMPMRRPISSSDFGSWSRVEAVAQADHLLLARRQRLDRPVQRVVAERDDDLLLDVRRHPARRDRRTPCRCRRRPACRGSRPCARPSAPPSRASTFSFAFSATSSSVGARSSSTISSRSARAIFCSRSTMCTGMRIVRDLFATPRCTAWRIHHVAYVENLKPRRQSNFSTARISPMIPSWIRSSSEQAVTLVLLRDRDDEAEVRVDHPVLRPLVAALDLLRELDLLGGGQQRVAPGLVEEELERVGRHRGDLAVHVASRSSTSGSPQSSVSSMPRSSICS